jgi:hypothetical protein
LGLDFPSTGLTADWIIINQATTAAWSGSATAFEARGGTGATTANIVYFPQSGSGVSTTTAGLYSSDPLFIKGDVQAAYYDFPDLSTPYISGATAGVYRNTLASTIARSSVINEFVTSDAIAAQTDLVFSQPLRRYYVAVTYGATAGVVRVDSTGQVSTSGEVYTSNNTALINRVLCVRRPTGSQLLAFAAFDREEQTLTPSGAVISPGTPTQFNICGEVAVTSINAGNASMPSALSATLARNNIELPFADGWIRFNTALDSVDVAGTGVTGLPIIGNAHLRAANGAVNYGFTWPHKTN